MCLLAGVNPSAPDIEWGENWVAHSTTIVHRCSQLVVRFRLEHP